MFSLVENPAEIAAAQAKLEVAVRKQLKRRIKRDIGWPGGRKFAQELYADNKYWCWFENFSAPGQVPRRHNWFGIYGDGPGVGITVEINTPLTTHNSRIAGFFARDSKSGRVYLFHSGGVAGGAPGVGKGKFLAWAALTPAAVLDSKDRLRFGVPVMPIEGLGAIRSVLRYVQQIADFKTAVRNKVAFSPEVTLREKALLDFYQEARGRRKGSRRTTAIDYVSRHGEVVDALAVWRTPSLGRGQKIVKNCLIDLGVKSGKRLAEVYEVKTSAARGDVYTAIGQLAVHSPDALCKRIVVLPAADSLHPTLARALIREKIQLLRYSLTATAAKIL